MTSVRSYAPLSASLLCTRQVAALCAPQSFLSVARRAYLSYGCSSPSSSEPTTTQRTRTKARLSLRCFTTTPQQRQGKQPPPFPTVSTCPSPTCGCAATPPMPDGLEIDRTSPLNGVISGYAEQVLICTGRHDWPSRIEEEASGDNLAADLKELFGKGGMYRDPFHNVSVLNASFPSSISPRPEIQSTSAYLLPSFKYVPFLPRVSFDAVQALAKGFLLPEKLHSMHDGLSPIHRDRLTRSEAYQNVLPGVKDVQDVLVLICGHGGRDMRCGVMGPVLKEEFEGVLGREGFDVRSDPVEVKLGNEGDGMAAQGLLASGGSDSASSSSTAISSSSIYGAARVGLISHIGGHKFAGNVIIYIPPGFKVDGQKEVHPLAGHGVWYGRVEPKHAEGIVKETILGGKVVEDMFRGGIDPQRRILRI